MNLGAFSVSLAVKDLAASRTFYEALGFVTIHGDANQRSEKPSPVEGAGWCVLKNGEHVIGLFQGMFPTNILTFNPGWGQDGQPSTSHTDIRELQKSMGERGLDVGTPIAEGAGPASFMLTDPDGNPILIDQHV